MRFVVVKKSYRVQFNVPVRCLATTKVPFGSMVNYAVGTKLPLPTTAFRFRHTKSSVPSSNYVKTVLTIIILLLSFSENKMAQSKNNV